ncbi:MAG: DUF4238 domain-containing protein [Alphaproteobacteria bacterium]|nr:DUF4238 domain-containing protein [Alphaproteobacteria bacterium]
MKQNNDTVRSHFVWRKYLENFSTDDQIFVKNIKTKETFHTHNKNVGVKRHIYTIKNKVTPAEQKIFMEYFKKSNGSPWHDIAESMISFINDDSFSIMAKYIDSSHVEIIKKIFKLETPSISLRQEEIFTHYENNFYPVFEKLMNQDISVCSYYEDQNFTDFFELISFISMKMFFTRKEIESLTNVIPKSLLDLVGFDESKEKVFQKIEDEKNQVFQKNGLVNEDIDKANFLIFFISQYFRTDKHISKLKEIFKNSPKVPRNINFDNFIYTFIHLRALLLIKNLLREKYHIIYLVNKTDSSFITSDQPIINTYSFIAKNLGRELLNDELEFFYPVSPNLAILFTNRPCYEKIHEINISKDDIAEYNKVLENKSHNFIYSKEAF